MPAATQRRHAVRWPIAALALLVTVVECTQAADLDIARQDLAIQASRVALSDQQPDAARLGALRYVTGLKLTAGHPAFGGLSGLRIGADGRRFLAVTDKGNWLDGQLTGPPDAPTGLADAEIGPLGRPADGDRPDQRGRDAEAVAELADASHLVAFEGRHRVLRYPSDGDPPLAEPAERVATPDGLQRASSNKGPEALLALADGRLLMLVEGLIDGGARVGYLRDDAGWHRVRYPLHPDYAPTDAAQLPGGDVLVLARRFDPIGGFQARIRRVAAETIAPGAMLDGPIVAHFRRPYVVDNYEGLDVRTAADGRTLVYVVSDDNFQPLQRTLLLVFALGEV